MDPDFSDNISFYLAYTACVVLFFFSVRLFFKHVLSCSEIVAVTAVALSHHIAVVAYSVLYNDAYLTLLHAGILFNTDGCGALSLRTDQVYYTGIFAVVYLAMDSVYAILMPAWRGEKRIDALLLFHHINGVALISCALFAGHGLYMVRQRAPQWPASC